MPIKIGAQKHLLKPQSETPHRVFERQELLQHEKFFSVPRKMFCERKHSIKVGTRRSQTSKQPHNWNMQFFQFFLKRRRILISVDTLSSSCSVGASEITDKK